MKVINPNAGVIKVLLLIYAAVSVFSFIGFFIPPLTVTATIAASLSGGLLFAAIIYSITGQKLQRIAHDIINGKNLLFHWKLTREESEKAYKIQRKQFRENVTTTLIALGIGPFILGLIGMIPADFIMMTGLSVVLIVFTKVFTSLYMRWEDKRTQGIESEVYIASNGLVLDGLLHIWDWSGRSLNNIVLDKDEEFITFSYYSSYKGNRNLRSVVVPVPAQKKEEARRLIEMYKADIAQITGRTEKQET